MRGMAEQSDSRAIDRIEKRVDNIDKYMSALMAFMQDTPDGTEVPDACRETAYCWATLARVKEHGGLNAFSENVITEVIRRLERATNLLEKVHAKR
jgi:hypothetical protein